MEGARRAGRRGGDPVRHPRPRAVLGLLRGLGWLVGPVVWLGCSLITARILDIPLAYVLFSAVAGGVAGLIVMLVTTHWAGIVAARLVFAAACGSYDPGLEAEAEAEAAAAAGDRAGP